MSIELSGKMIWKGYIAVEMVDGWTDLQVDDLLNALDEAVDTVFESKERQVLDTNPLVRLVVEL